MRARRSQLDFFRKSKTAEEMDTSVSDRDSTALPVTEFADEPRPLAWRELAGVLLLVVISDLAIYRGKGFGGYGVLFGLVPVGLGLGALTLRRRVSWIFILTLIGLAGRLIWSGSWLAVLCGFFCTVALAMCLSGQSPQILSLFAYTGQVIPSGAAGLNAYGSALLRALQPIKSASWLAVVMPAAAVVSFGTIFILANPDLVSWLSQEWQAWFDQFGRWLMHFSMLEIPLWIATAWIGVGLMRPLGNLELARPPEPAMAEPVNQAAALYPAFRNTLVTVSGLYAAYLVFEFQTLWFREFPTGFYYSGYAHEGAAWLTVALALATVTMSLIFRGQTLVDPRLPRLKCWAWAWSALNLLLALAVYNRLFIYVGFNGMTRMRMVGLFGTTAVILGFLLAVYKIAKHRGFVWLFRSDLWALAATIVLYALTPVDLLVMRYNAHRILSGDSAPSVQISVHPIDAEGVRELLPLLDCQDEIVRDGIRALCVQRWTLSQRGPAHRPIAVTHWDDFSRLQISERLLVRELAQRRDRWDDFDRNPAQATAAWQKFKDYAYQWY
jgi:hypothetical protein